MAHYHEPPAKLTQAEWEEVEQIFKSCGQSKAFELLRKKNNESQCAGSLFAPEDVYSKGQGNINRRLGKVNSVFVLSRMAYTSNNDGTPREDRLLALVRKPK